jgi:uncharacterized protein YndB with AHSA1/START domain
MEDDVVELELWIAAAPRVVYAFLTDAQKFVRWMGVSTTIEPMPRGIFRIDLNGADVARGAYVELVPDERVVFTWGWEGSAHGIPPGSTTVAIDLVPENGGTRLRLRHSGLSGDNRDKHAYGWGHYLGRLKQISEGVDPGPDPLARPEVHHA